MVGHSAVGFAQYGLIRIVQFGEVADQFSVRRRVVATHGGADDGRPHFGATGSDAGNDDRNHRAVARGREYMACGLEAFLQS